MSRIDMRLNELGLILPEPLILPPGADLPFPWVSTRGNRVLISGHGPVDADGSLSQPRGQVGDTVTPEEAKVLAGKVALTILRSLQDELGDLDRITGWVKILGMVNSAPGFNQQPEVINGFTEIILSVFGPEVGRHARSAVGMAALPFDISVEIEGEVEIQP
ncbi:MAG: RidA family protein [Paracoccaceae bacterium]